MDDKISKDTSDLIDSAFSSISKDDVIIPGFYKKVFNFQGKKSFLIAQKIIRQTTKPDALIFDPFFGSGSFLIAAAKENRKIIGTEIDNYTFFTVKTLLEKCDMEKLEHSFREIKALVYDYVMDLYATHCTCGQANHIYKLHFDPQTDEYINPTPHRDIKNGENIIFTEKCMICGKKTKKCTCEDIEKIQQIEKLDSSKFPHHSFIENSRINITASTGADKYDSNFTNRSKIALLKIQDAITNLPNCVEKDVIELALVFSLPLSKISMYGSGTNNLYHVIMYSAQEMNVWSIFELKYKALLKYKENLCSILQNSFTANDKIEIHNCDFESFLSKNNYEFDAIYTDPPYTDQVPYLEYQQLYRDWLQHFYDSNSFLLTSEMLKNEIVVTNAPSRKEKDYDHYILDIDKMFSLFYKHLKDYGFVFLTIKLGEKKYFNVLTQFVELARKNGFWLVSKYALENDDPTIRKQAAYLSTISTQVILCFQKLPLDKVTWYISNINIEKLVIEKCYKEIKNSKSSYVLEQEIVFEIKKEIFNKTAITLSFGELKKIQNIIKEHFVVRDNSYVLLNPNELYLGLEEQSSLFVKLLDIVPVLVNKLLSKYSKFTLDDLYTEIANLLCDCDQSLLDSFLQDSNYKSQIINLVSNYCEESNNVYIKKQLTNIASKDAKDISCMDGYQFEHLIQNLLIAQGYKNVVRIGGAGDRGVDLIAVNPITNQKNIFQCKRWIGDVGSDPIQRLHSFMTMEETIKEAICITTSNYTKEGKIIAEKTGVKTINGYQLLALLNKFFPGKYYHGALKNTEHSS